MKKRDPNKAERTKRFIIEKAAPIFNKKGIAGTSLSDLTEATGLTKGSIYGNFKDKDEVAVCVFQYNVDNLISYLTRAIDKENTSIDKLLAIPKAYRKLYKTMIAYGGCPLLKNSAEAEYTQQGLLPQNGSALENKKKTLFKIRQSGQHYGGFHTDKGKHKNAKRNNRLN